MPNQNPYTLVDPGKIIRGPRPASASDLVSANICAGETILTDLSLETGCYEFFHLRMFQEDMVGAGNKCLVLHEPLSNFFFPTKDVLDEILKKMTNTFMLPMLVHCRWGKDRTGLVIGYYRVKVNGWPVEAAINEMVANGMHWPYRLFWIPRFRKIANIRS